MQPEELYLCSLLKQELTGNTDHSEESYEQKVQMDQVITKALEQGVLSLLYDRMMNKEAVLENQKNRIRKYSQQIVQQNYHLLFLARFITEKLKKHGIASVILKGSAMAAYYPVPELRKSGDLDILVSKNADLKQICEVLSDDGIKKAKDQHANYHMRLTTRDGIAVEIHTSLTEETGILKLDNYQKKHQDEFLHHTVMESSMEIVIPTLDFEYVAYFILIHMFQHFLRAGFGTKMLCDWVALWNREVKEEQKRAFLAMVEESGIRGFACMVSAVCITYLGLKAESMEFLVDMKQMDAAQIDTFLTDVMEAGEFGDSSEERMVMVQENGLPGLIAEFRHQVALTYPKAYRCVLCRPVLWIMLLIGFIHRNRVLRNVSTSAILKSAAKRGKQMKEMNLFEK